MAAGSDILQLFPEIAAIGAPLLQAYCNDWLKRPIAREFGITRITVDADLLTHINLDISSADLRGTHAFVPIDELLGYIVERHLPDADKRRELHQSIRDTRRRWCELDRDYEVTLGRCGTLYLTCKNPVCGAIWKPRTKRMKGSALNSVPLKSSASHAVRRMYMTAATSN